MKYVFVLALLASSRIALKGCMSPEIYAKCTYLAFNRMTKEKSKFGYTGTVHGDVIVVKIVALHTVLDEGTHVLDELTVQSRGVGDWEVIAWQGVNNDPGDKGAPWKPQPKPTPASQLPRDGSCTAL